MLPGQAMSAQAARGSAHEELDAAPAAVQTTQNAPRTTLDAAPAAVRTSPAAAPAAARTRPDAVPAAGPMTPGAAPAAVRMTFDAAPEPVAKGEAVSLTGRVWRTARGNQARVDFYFHANGTPANSFTYQGFATTTDAGHFSHRAVAQTTGTWKAVYAGSTSRRNAARLDAVQVFQRRSREIAGWSQQTGAWQSPTIRIPTQDYKAIFSWTCPQEGSPFVHLAWTGQGGGSEYVHGAKPTGTLTLNGHAGARNGFFKVSTSADCTWRVRVFSGIAAFQV
ncbi:hypothetical protein AB0C29_23015 [Actinoplanes sp. NPDC048791]|uniref:hypothetical protein n=1 Tax=Actinoplanes sp. NPDC048791 TaxID=3154623 RepID=UPI0033F06B08